MDIIPASVAGDHSRRCSLYHLAALLPSRCQSMASDIVGKEDGEGPEMSCSREHVVPEDWNWFPRPFHNSTPRLAARTIRTDWARATWEDVEAHLAGQEAVAACPEVQPIASRTERDIIARLVGMILASLLVARPLLRLVPRLQTCELHSRPALKGDVPSSCAEHQNNYPVIPCQLRFNCK